MREIKFRAWFTDGESAVMDGQSMSVMDERSLVEFLESVEDVVDDHGYAANLMQYTGLKDKNGTDIYEGDIVTIDGAILTSGRVVTWDVAEYMLDPEYEPSDLTELWLSQRLEVIGNIHENGDLINN